MKLHEDAYYESFTAGQYEDIKNAQSNLEKETIWESHVSGMEVLPLSTPMDVEVRSLSKTNQIPKEVLLDTQENLGLMLRYP